MKRVVAILALAASFECGVAGRLQASFEDIGTGARAAALGGAYVALGDDTLSLFYNPAELARLRQKEIATEYSRLYTGLTDQSNISQYVLSYGMPIKAAGTAAIGWKQLHGDGLYSERTFSLGYGQWLTQRLSAGVAIKQLYHAFEAPSVVVDDNGNIQNGTPSLFSEEGRSKSAFSADAGLLYRVTDRQALGFSIQDLNAPNVALDAGDRDIVARTVRFGWAYQSARKLSLTTALTTRQCPCDRRDYTAIGGAEKWWDARRGGAFALRGALGFGTGSLQQLSTGFGYRVGFFQLDYAFVFNLSGITLGDTGGTHRFSIAYRFGSEATPATTPMGTPVEDRAVNILSVPKGALENDPLDQDQNP